MQNFWIFRSHYREGSRWFAHWLARIPPKPTSTRALALARYGWMAVHLGDIETTRTVLLEALVVARAVRDRPTEARSLMALGLVDMQRGDYPSAVAWSSQALDQYRGLEGRSTKHLIWST